MIPDEQDIAAAARIAEQFLSQTTDRLVIIIVALFVVFLILGALVTLYMLRNMGGRDKTTHTVVTQLSLIITQQGKSLEQQDRVIQQRDEEYRSLFVKVAEGNERSDKLHVQSADTLKNVSLYIEQQLKDLASNQARNVAVLSDHDKRAETGIADILTAIGRVEAKVSEVSKTVAEIKAFFPPGRGDVLARLERQLAEAIEQLKDCGKIATDENPVVLIPVEQEAEDADELTPGKGKAA